MRIIRDLHVLSHFCPTRSSAFLGPVAVRPKCVQSGHERVEEKAMRMVILAVLPLALTGCIAKTALDVATLPVKAASKTVDVMTTSQSEADEKRGRAVRKQEECVGKEQRQAEREGRAPATSRSEEHTSELQSLMRTSYAVFCLKKKKKKRRSNEVSKN